MTEARSTHLCAIRGLIGLALLVTVASPHGAGRTTTQLQSVSFTLAAPTVQSTDAPSLVSRATHARRQHAREAMATAGMPSSRAGGETAQDPSTLPLLELGNIEYLGGFRLPDGAFGSENGFSFGGGPMAFNPANNSLFIGGHPYDMMIAEVSIPTPVQSEDVSKMPFADVLQAFADPTEGNAGDLLSEGNFVNLGGLLVSGGKLYGTAYIYYDADNEQRASHYSRSLDLSQASASGLNSVYIPEATGFVSGYLAEIPAEWQSTLGGPAITGQCCIPAVSRTSWGPDAFAWNPSDIDLMNPVPATPLTKYDTMNPTLGQWEGSNSTWGATTLMGGVALLAGSRTALYVGVNGTGPFCYGPGTDDPSLDGQDSGDGEFRYCYDPVRGDQAPHAYPYNFQFWAYDLNDWAAVNQGKKQPWEVTPYAVWPFELPTGGLYQIGGVAYDSANQLLYVSQVGADQDGYAFRPVIHVFHIH